MFWFLPTSYFPILGLIRDIFGRSPLFPFLRISENPAYSSGVSFIHVFSFYFFADHTIVITRNLALFFSSHRLIVHTVTRSFLTRLRRLFRGPLFSDILMSHFSSRSAITMCLMSTRNQTVYFTSFCGNGLRSFTNTTTISGL